jgi:hypothetical protein
MTTLTKITTMRKRIWAKQKEIKDMLKTAWWKKEREEAEGEKEKKKSDSPNPKRKEKKERNGPGEEVHTPSTKNTHSHEHLDQGLWLVCPLDPVFDLAKYEKQVCLQIPHAYSSIKSSH